ncbi:MAG TPA: LLM class F420-dependent oxidoreductase [Acidimicrobiales bacterium]|nr:LLM class F420-dependent oxidoreductase [Acidimicrobiales bacterium]
MRYGLMLDTSKPVDDVVAQARSMAQAGFAGAWSSQVFGYEALTVLAIVGREVPGIEVGTAVIPIYPRHPIVLAQQALTTQHVAGGRLVLGIGLSHQIVIEGMYGYSFDKPARAMREYLDALLPLLRGEQVSYQGETVKAMTMGPLDIKVDRPPPVLLAALAPVMLKLAGAVADGTITWMTGPDTLANHIVPTITKAATEAGRPAPRVGAGLPVCVTDDPDGARERADRAFAIYGQLPSYRAMLDKEGAAGPGQVAIVGDEETVARQVRALADAGVTDFAGAPYGDGAEIERTVAVLAQLAREG